METLDILQMDVLGAGIPGVTVLGAVSAVAMLLLWASNRHRRNSPPVVSSIVPFFGAVASFGVDPKKFLVDAYHKHGEIFSFTMLGKRFTYVIGADASATFFDADSKILSARHAYEFTVPVFGPGVVYDVPRKIMSEQMRMVKFGLLPQALRSYVPFVVEEVDLYFNKHWKGDSGEADLLDAMAECIIMTASRCLHGAEIRAMMDESVAKLYEDIDGGFTPLGFFLPHFPFPEFRRRDKARSVMEDKFRKIMEDRRESSKKNYNDMLEVLMEARYSDNTKLEDTQICGLLIALLLAGQHTSSTTSTWMGLYLGKHKGIMKRVLQEIEDVVGDSPLDYDVLGECKLLSAVLTETLRLSPPIITVMRKVMVKREYKGYVIPEGDYLCTSPLVTGLDPEKWVAPSEFDPDRFLEPRCEMPGEYGYVPFGANRSKCIGEAFALMQIRTIWITLLKRFEIELIADDVPEPNFKTLIVMPGEPRRVRWKRRQ